MSQTPLFSYVLGLADTSLVLGHRLSEWVARAPTLEEDIAISNLALDLIGQARMFYDYAGKVEGAGRDEDSLAYLRDDRQYKNLLLVEQPNGDFATTMVRQFLYAAFASPYYVALKASKDETLAAIAAKAEKEIAYHLRHAGEWVIRLGDGTEESHARAQAALDELAPYIHDMFETAPDERALIEAGIAPDLSPIKQEFDATLARVFDEATLTRPKVRNPQLGGKRGAHGEHLGQMLAVMQSVHRQHPGAVW